MNEKVYQRIASKVVAYHNCVKSHNMLWERQHAEDLREIERNCLPSGSDTDFGCTIDIDKSSDMRIVINSSYHVMVEGRYSGWVDFVVTAKPSLAFGIVLDIRWQFSKCADLDPEGLKDYLLDTFSAALHAS